MDINNTAPFTSRTGFDIYRTGAGDIIKVDRDVCRSASIIDYTQKDGRVVLAIFLGHAERMNDATMNMVTR